MCCLYILEIYMTLVLEILSVIIDVHHQAGLQQSPYANSGDEDGRGHQSVVTFVFECGWTNADG